MAWHVYIIECSDGSLYTGITNDLDRRITAHNDGQGGKYTKSRRPVRLRYSELAADRKNASQREYAIKSLRKAKKMRLITPKPLITT
jgi:putative endonuclease